jgi:beta-N-acetylhexosaminidase
MELEALIGAKLAVGLRGAEVTEQELAQLRALRIRALIVFARNLRSPPQVAALLRRLEEALEDRLLVMVDHEGGRVVRFAEGVTRFPDALTIGRSRSAEEVRQQGRVEAQELARLGIRVNLAPCVDVLMDGADPIIGERSYGSDPTRVAELAVARIEGLQSQGVAACAKHFPGLGAVPRDPHVELATIRCGWEEMERRHLVPFCAAIQAGVAMVMSSHVCYPWLGDPEGLPATFSPRLIRDLLRARERFAGVILTDDLEMGAVRGLCGLGEAAVRATAAGHDLLLICSDATAAREAFDALREAVRIGRLDRTDLEASAQRLTRVRARFLGERLLGGP